MNRWKVLAVGIFAVYVAGQFFLSMWVGQTFGLVWQIVATVPLIVGAWPMGMLCGRLSMRSTDRVVAGILADYSTDVLPLPGGGAEADERHAMSDAYYRYLRTGEWPS